MRGILGRRGGGAEDVDVAAAVRAHSLEPVDNECNENDYHLSLDDVLLDHNTHVGEQETS